jgi:DNA-binding HxlR family transcriptional regulator
VTFVRRVSFDEMQCSMARTLEVVGEWWTPLIVREVSLGRRRFEEIQDDLGISRNVLTDRLNKLVDEGVLERRNIAQTGTRHEYHLTEKGHDLFALLVALLQWGDKWVPNPKGPHTELVHTGCGHVTHPVLTCSSCGEPITDADIRARPGKRFRDDPDHPLVRRAKTATR